MVDDRISEVDGKLIHKALTEQIIGAAIEVHKAIGLACLNLFTRNVCVTR